MPEQEPAPTRTYRSARREQAAARTREDILRAARELFVTCGYPRVTVADIARSADVAVKTVYASVGTKTQLLHALIAADIAASDAAGTTDEVRTIRELAPAIAHLAHAIRGNTERFAASSIALLLSAVASDEKAREVWDFVIARYREALRDTARHLVAIGVVAPHLDEDAVADRLWLCFGLYAWRTLVVDCGWSYDDAERLLARQAVALLEDPAPV